MGRVPASLEEHPEPVIVVVGVCEERHGDGVSVELQVPGHLLPAQVPPLPTGLVLDGQVIVAVSVAGLQPERISEGKNDRFGATVSDRPSTVEVSGVLRDPVVGSLDVINISGRRLAVGLQ